MPQIRPLSQQAISQIRSSSEITSLSGTIIALLKNSLDAEATRIDIIVDFKRGCCTVEDNGQGIPISEFAETGGLAKPYHTSKCDRDPSSERHGSDGCFLASLATLSLLSITSCHVDSEVEATLTINHGAIVARSYPSSQSNKLFSNGTRVSVRNLFGHMPVRVKQREKAVQSSAGVDVEWFALRRGVVATVLAWPRPCSVKIRELEPTGRTLNIPGWHPLAFPELTKKNLHRLSNPNTTVGTKAMLSPIFQSGLAPMESRKDWVSVSASTSNTSIKGAICTQSSPSKQCQFISIGIQPCSSESVSQDLYGFINKLFSNSAFGSHELEKPKATSVERHHKRADRWPMFVLRVNIHDEEGQQSKQVDVDDAKLMSILDVLKACVNEWLASHYFRRKRRVGVGDANDQSIERHASLEGYTATDLPLQSTRDSPRIMGSEDAPNVTDNQPQANERSDVAPQILPQEPRRALAANVTSKSASVFGSWSRIKSGRRSMYEAHKKVHPITNSDDQPKKKSSISEIGTNNDLASGHVLVHSIEPSCHATTIGENAALDNLNLRSEDFGSVDENDMLALERTPALSPAELGLEEDPSIDWIDPTTRQVCKINARTGMKVSLATSDNQYAMVRSEPRCLKTLPNRTGPNASRSGTPWLPEFLKAWDNPVFPSRQELPIPSVSLETSGEGMTNCRPHREHETEIPVCFGGLSHVSTTILKSSLQNAQVIRQVDRKFILCKMARTETSTHRDLLVIIDQHAASERVILEDLLTRLCAPIDPASPLASFTTNTSHRSPIDITLLERPLTFQITREEHTILQTSAAHLAHWGILYDLHASVGMATSESRLAVRALPPTIAERCALLPDLVIELVRREIWHQADLGARVRTTATTARHDWVRRVGSCPAGVLELLNSRACRSAVMFNDVLDEAECAELLGRLGECVFPYTCAHGRVGMVPLVAWEMGSEEGESFLGEGEVSR